MFRADLNWTDGGTLKRSNIRAAACNAKCTLPLQNGRTSDDDSRPFGLAGHVIGVL